MITASGAFAAMVEGHSHNITVSASIDVPGSDPDINTVLASVSVDSSTTTDVPTGTRMPVGYPAVSADLTLSGPLGAGGMPVASWFHPYQRKSPLYRTRIVGAPVTVKFGLYPDGSRGVPELIQKFTGFVDSYVVDPLAGTVQLACIDYRTKLRSAVNLPAVITSAPYNSGLTAEYALDQVLRAASGGAVSTWYPTRPNAQFAAGLRGSVWPEVGALTVSGGPSPRPLFGPGAYGTALADLAAVPGGTADPLTLAWSVDPVRNGGVLGDTFFAEALFSWDGSTGGESIDIQFGRATSYFRVGFVGGTGGGIVLTAGNAALSTSATTTWLMPVTPGPHYLALLVYWPSGGATCWVTPVLDDTFGPQLSLANTRASAFSTVILTKPAARLSNGTWAALVVTPDGALPTPLYSDFTPTATVDPSLNHIVAMPATSGDPWQVVQSIADAEQAVAGFDPENGGFRFRNRKTLRSGQPAREVSSLTSLIDLQISVDMAAFANRVQVPWAGYSFAAAYSTIYSLDTLLKVPRNSSVTLTPSLTAALAVDVQSTVTVAATGQVDTANSTRSVYRACTDSGGLNAHPGVNFLVTQPGADQLVIKITNPTNQDAYLISPAKYTDILAGTPVLIISGRAVTPSDPMTADVQFPPMEADGSGGAASTSDGEVLYQAPDNVWLQDGDSAQQLAVDTLSDLNGARPNLTNLAIVPDPRLQLMDWITLVDHDNDITVHAIVWAQTISLADSDGTVEYTHTLDVRALASPGNWLLGIDGRSEVGLTTYI